MKALKLAGCVITNNEGAILLVHRSLPKLKQWEIPGGKIDPGETPGQTAVREIREELGIEVKIIKFAGTKSFIYKDIDHEYSWFMAIIVSGTPKIMEPQYFDKLRYFSPEDLSNHSNQFSKNVKNYLATIGNNK